MLRYIVQRLLLLPFLLVLFSIIVFWLVQAPPGDFLTSYVATLASAGSSINEAQVERSETNSADQPACSVPPLDRRDSARDLGNVAGIPASQHRIDRRTFRADDCVGALRFCHHVDRRNPRRIYSATHQNSLLDYVPAVLNYIGVATPNFMLALILMWMAFSNLGIDITGLFSPELFRRRGL